jgi:hypothetical protein
MTHDRRDVLKGIGATTAVVAVGGIGSTVAADRDDGEARVRVVHASPDAPAVDVLVDGDEVLSGVRFGTVTDYLTVPAGTYTVTIAAADDPSTVAFEGEVTVEGREDYTVAAVGELSEGTFRPLVIEDENAINSDFIARARVVHASPDAPAVDVTAGEAGAIPLVNDVAFGGASRYRTVLAGETPIQVRPESPANDADPVLETTLPVEGGVTYTVFATGYLTPDDEPTDEGFGLLPATGRPRGASGPDVAKVRVAHASPDAPNVDVFVDDERVLSDVPFKAVSDYLSLQPGTYAVAITAAGDPDAVAFEGEVTVEADAAYTVAAVGELGAGTFRPAVLVDDLETEFGEAKLRVLHASPDAPAVDVTTEDAGTTLVDGLAFGEATGFASLDPGRYELEVRPDSEDNDNPFDAEFAATLRPGRVYTAIATGYFTADDEPADEPFDLVLGAVDEGDH